MFFTRLKASAKEFAENVLEFFTFALPMYGVLYLIHFAYHDTELLMLPSVRALVVLIMVMACAIMFLGGAQMRAIMATGGDQSPAPVNNGGDDSDEEVEPGPTDWWHEMMCPITFSIMKDPVIACDGRTYEREAIERWIIRNEQVDGSGMIPAPLTNVPMGKTLTPNHAMKKMIPAFLKSHKKNQQKADCFGAMKQLIKEQRAICDELQGYMEEAATFSVSIVTEFQKFMVRFNNGMKDNVALQEENKNLLKAWHKLSYEKARLESDMKKMKSEIEKADKKMKKLENDNKFWTDIFSTVMKNTVMELVKETIEDTVKEFLYGKRCFALTEAPVDKPDSDRPLKKSK